MSNNNSTNITGFHRNPADFNKTILGIRDSYQVTEVPMLKLFVVAGTGVEYACRAMPGTLESLKRWQVVRYTPTVAAPTAIDFADGGNDFTLLVANTDGTGPDVAVLNAYTYS